MLQHNATWVVATLRHVMLKHNLRTTNYELNRMRKRAMAGFRRYFVPGGTYFFTLVTAGRAPLFGSAQARAILGSTMREQREQAPFQTIAIVLLPDHLHAIWTLPSGDDDYPNRWKAIKARFTSAWLKAGGREQPTSEGYAVKDAVAYGNRDLWNTQFATNRIFTTTRTTFTTIPSNTVTFVAPKTGHGRHFIGMSKREITPSNGAVQRTLYRISAMRMKTSWSNRRLMLQHNARRAHGALC